MTNTLLRSCDAVVSCDDDNTIHRNVDVLIRGNVVKKIAANIPDPDLPDRDKLEIIDASGHFVYPGLINTHHHFFQCFVRNPWES